MEGATQSGKKGMLIQAAFFAHRSTSPDMQQAILQSLANVWKYQQDHPNGRAVRLYDEGMNPYIVFLVR